MNNNIVMYLENTYKKYPDKVAYYGENDALTYRELLNNSEKIATEITKRKILRKPIVIYMEKSARCIATFWGIAYSGNFYTPIDVEMPLDRVKKIFATLQPELIITSEKYLEQINSICNKVDIFLYENIKNSKVNRELISEAKNQVMDTDLLYVLFTSGSTGTPKGVTISHRAVIDFAETVNATFHITNEEIIGNQGPFYFDLSVLDLYCTVFAGATMYIIPPELFKFPVNLLNYLNEKRINTIYWVPSALVVVANLRALKAVELPYLKKIMFCGEVMPNKQLNVWRKHLPDALYVNMYGPTETTCASSYYIIDRAFEDEESLPIGKPFQNTKIIVLNDKEELITKEGIGELCIAGSSLSLGYYKEPEKTNEYFIQNPLNKCFTERIYRTGDLVTYNRYGELEYISRKDFQIKHMGHRIELGEIETAVSMIKGITTCCCVYDDLHNKIVLYVIDAIDSEIIIREISKKLPDYMIPNKIVLLQKLPFNANGKIDRNKLKQMTL